jgi:hypothetical protein
MLGTEVAAHHLGERVEMRVLLHPVALFATATLILNDHVLKARYPGWVTGKLSDFAGMVVAPLVLVAIADALAPAALVKRRGYERASAWVCVALVGCAFAAVKTWAPATRLYEAAFGLLWGRAALVRDPTDLFALPFGLVAVWIRDVQRVEASTMAGRWERVPRSPPPSGAR